MGGGALRAMGMIALGCLVAGMVAVAIVLAFHPAVVPERRGAVCEERVVQLVYRPGDNGCGETQ